MTYLESLAHIAAAAALSAGMIGVGFGALGAVRRGASQRRPIWLVGGAGGALFTLYVANAELNWNAGDPALLWVGVAVFVGTVVGGALVARGLRGRYVGDHEHCRRCGFDLFGRPVDARVCGECGAPLDSPRATVVGVRHRRPVPLLVGAFLAVACLAIGGSAARVVLTGDRAALAAIRFEPLGWLVDGILATGAANARRQQADREELYRRLADGELDDGDVRTVIDAATRHPGGFGVMHLAEPFAFAAWSRGLLDEATIRPIVRRQAEASIAVARESAADRVPFRIGLHSPSFRFEDYSRLVWSCAIADRVDTIGGVAVPAAAIVPAGKPQLGFEFNTTPDLGRLYRLPAPLPAGPADIEVRVTVTLTLAAVGRPTIAEAVPVALRATTTIVPGLTRRLRADGNRPREFNGLASARIRPGPAAGRATIAVWLPSRSVWPTFIGDAFAVGADGVERPLGEAYVAATGTIEVADDLMASPPFSIVLRPTPERGAEFLEDVAAYQHEIVVADSNIDRPRRPATTRP